MKKFESKKKENFNISCYESYFKLFNRKRIERKNAPQKLKTDEQLKKIQTHQNNISVKILDRMKKFDASFLSSLTVKTNDPIDPIQIDSNLNETKHFYLS